MPVHGWERPWIDPEDEGTPPEGFGGVGPGDGMYAGGSPYFDETTGQRVKPREDEKKRGRVKLKPYVKPMPGWRPRRLS